MIVQATVQRRIVGRIFHLDIKLVFVQAIELANGGGTIFGVVVVVVVVMMMVMVQALVLLVGIHLRPVNSFDVFPQRTRIGVLFHTTRNTTSVRLLVRMSAILMFRSVGSVREGFLTVGKLAHVRLLPGMRSKMRLEILQTRISF